MKNWLESNIKKLNLAGKLGGAYATEQYIHGGAENAIKEMIVFMMVAGMMVYSGGSSCGKPVIHLGPVGMIQNIEDFEELFITYGKRMGEQLGSLQKKS
jgi:NAD(P)H dehydrogenase (quinone)